MVAAQNTDLQRVWRLVQELSAQLSANQQETERLRRHIELGPSIGFGTSHSQNGSSEKSLSRSVDQEEYSTLRRAYATLADENIALKSESEDLSHLCAEYELGLTQAMEQIRNHEHEVTTSTLALHRNYSSQIEAKNLQKAALETESVEIQGHLLHLNKYVRDALNVQTDVAAESIIETLALENEALRDRLLETEARLDAYIAGRPSQS